MSNAVSRPCGNDGNLLSDSARPRAGLPCTLNRHMKLLRHLVCSLLALIAIGAVARSHVAHATTATRLSAADKRAFENPGAFTVSYRTEAVSDALRTAFARAVGDTSWSMAEPGAAWQATDYITKPGLPRRRLIFIAVSSDGYAVLHYELGGRGHSYHILLFRLSPRDAEITWRCVVDGPLAGMSQLVREIDRGGVNDDPRYGF